MPMVPSEFFESWEQCIIPEETPAPDTQIGGIQKEVGDQAKRQAMDEALPSNEQLIARIERQIRRDTQGGIRDLHVEMTRAGVTLYGYCGTYYMKQKAQRAAMDIPGALPLTNAIEVTKW